MVLQVLKVLGLPGGGSNNSSSSSLATVQPSSSAQPGLTPSHPVNAPTLTAGATGANSSTGVVQPLSFGAASKAQLRNNHNNRVSGPTSPLLRGGKHQRDDGKWNLSQHQHVDKPRPLDDKPQQLDDSTRIRPSQPSLSEKMSPFLLYRSKEKKDKDKRGGSTPSGETTPTSLSAPTSPAPRPRAFRQSRIPTVNPPATTTEKSSRNSSRLVYSSPPPNICVEKGRIEFIKAPEDSDEPEPLPQPVLAMVTTAAPTYATASATAVATFQSPAPVSAGQIRVLNANKATVALRAPTREESPSGLNSNVPPTLRLASSSSSSSSSIASSKRLTPSASTHGSTGSSGSSLSGNNSSTGLKLPEVSKLTLGPSQQQPVPADARKTADGKWMKSRTGNSPQRQSTSPRLFMPLPPPPAPPTSQTNSSSKTKLLQAAQTSSPPQLPPQQLKRPTTKPPTGASTRIPRMNNDHAPSQCLPVPSVRTMAPSGLPSTSSANTIPSIPPEPVPRTTSLKVLQLPGSGSGPVPRLEEMNPEVGLGRRSSSSSSSSCCSSGFSAEDNPNWNNPIKSSSPAKEEHLPSSKQQQIVKDYEVRLAEAEQKIQTLETENDSLRRQLAEAEKKTVRLDADHVAALENQLEQQRVQYERCLDDVASNVVQALLAQKSLQADCRRLRVQVADLESQNAALSLVVSHSLRAGSRVDPALLAQLVTGVVAPQSRSDPASPAWRHSVCSTSSDSNFQPSVTPYQDANWSFRTAGPVPSNYSNTGSTSSTITTNSVSSPTSTTPQNRAEDIISLLKNRLFHLPSPSSPPPNPLYRQSLPVFDAEDGTNCAEIASRPATLNLHLNCNKKNLKDIELAKSNDSRKEGGEPPSPSVKDIVHVLEQKLGTDTSPVTAMQAMINTSQPRLLPVLRRKDGTTQPPANTGTVEPMLADAESPVSAGEMTSRDEGYSTMSSDVQPECHTCSSSTESSFLETSASSSPATLRRFTPVTLTRSLPVTKRRHQVDSNSTSSAHLGIKNRSVSLQETATVTSGLLEEVKEVSDEVEVEDQVFVPMDMVPDTGETVEAETELKPRKRVKGKKASQRNQRHSFYFESAGPDVALLTRCCSDSELYKEPVKKESISIAANAFWLDHPKTEARWMTLQLKPKTSPATVHNTAAGHPLRRTQAHSRLGSESSRSTPSDGESEELLARAEEEWEVEGSHASMPRAGYKYKHEEMEDWTLHLSTEDFERRMRTTSFVDLESPSATEVQHSNAHLTASLPSIQENSIELEEDAHDCLWNTATYFEAHTDSDGLSQASKRLSCLSDLLFQQQSKCSSVNDLEDLETGEPIDTEFTRDFYRLIKFESSRSLAASLKSLAVSETALKTEEEEPNSPPPDRQVALQSVLQFIAEQQRYCQRRQSQDAAIAVAANTQTVCLQELRALCDQSEDEKVEFDGWSNEEEDVDEDDEDVEHSGCSTGWVHLKRGRDCATDPQCRAALLDAMLVSSSSSCCSCCSGSPDSVPGGGREILEDGGFGMSKPEMGFCCQSTATASERPSILDPSLFVRYGRQEEEAIAAFRFLEQLSPRAAAGGSDPEPSSRNSTLNSILSRERVSFYDSNLDSD